MKVADDSLYCKFFVFSGVEESELRRILVDMLQGVLSGRSIVAEEAIADVRKNPDSDDSQDDDFLYWPLIVDVQLLNRERRTAVGSVREVLNTLWNRGYRVIAACDFEDELPRNGGYHDGVYLV